MRYAIGTIPHRGGRARAQALCAFVRRCKADFGAFVPFLPRELRKKQAVTASSLEKIEDGKSGRTSWAPTDLGPQPCTRSPCVRPSTISRRR
jgi:hypothetical protein